MALHYLLVPAMASGAITVASDQTIFRVASRHKPYAMLGNAMLRDKRLSFEARRLSSVFQAIGNSPSRGLQEPRHRPRSGAANHQGTRRDGLLHSVARAHALRVMGLDNVYLHRRASTAD
jgi:hypothetical protein